MRVLVVEDEPKMAGLVKRGLEEEGIAVDAASRGDDAVWMAGSTEYEAVVLDELLARLRALTRRGSAARPAVLEAGDLRLDPATRRVTRGDVDVTLSPKEYALLETLMRRP